MTDIVTQVITLEELRSVPLFASLDNEAAVELRSLLTINDVTAGSVLFNHGDTGDAMYLIESGRVRIHVEDSTGQDVTLIELAGGDFFGEMAILDGKPRSADATVIESARLAILNRDDFITFVRRNPDVSLAMLSAITDRLRHTDDLLRQRVSRNANEIMAARMTLSDRMANRLAGFGGSWKFIAVFMVFIFVWVLLNVWLIVNKQFDEYPYNLLDLVIGIIAGLQAPIILMSQNRQSEQDRLRSDIDFQINLKNELSLAELLRRLDVLESERLPKLFEEQNARMDLMTNSSSAPQAVDSEQKDRT
jgi:CRP/FNR family transcriptional regulator, cyclic AMP receptor protein